MKPTTQNLRILAIIVASIIPAIAMAEPGVSHAHVPYLWALATGVAAGIAFGIVKVTSKTRLMRTPLRRWVIGVLLFAGFMIFLVPLILVFGGILITGRTM